MCLLHIDVSRINNKFKIEIQNVAEFCLMHSLGYKKKKKTGSDGNVFGDIFIGVQR